MCNLTPDSLSEVEGTKGQNESQKWYSEGWPRITASTCLDAYRAGKKVMEDDNYELKELIVGGSPFGS